MLGSFSALKLSSDNPNLPRTVFPRSFSLPATQHSKLRAIHLQLIKASRQDTPRIKRLSSIFIHILVAFRLYIRWSEHARSRGWKCLAHDHRGCPFGDDNMESFIERLDNLPIISSFIFSLRSSTMGSSFFTIFFMAASSGSSSNPCQIQIHVLTTVRLRDAPQHY